MFPDTSLPLPIELFAQFYFNVPGSSLKAHQSLEALALKLHKSFARLFLGQYDPILWFTKAHFILV